MRRSFLAGLLLVGLVGCSPTVRATRLGPPVPPRPADSQVQLFSVRTPECPFDELSLLKVHYDGGQIPGITTSDTEALDAVKRKTRALGGDAIAGVTYFESSESTRGIMGTAIRFKDGSCRQ